MHPYPPTGQSPLVPPRHILHIDMNAFYCACHAAANPAQFANKATAVAGNPKTRHGILVTASYEARRRGVRATMTVMEALRKCPNLILIQPDFDLYREYSKRAFQIVRSYTPLVEIFSIDECWADITGSSQFGTAEEIAASIQKRLVDELGLPCSIGISENKFLAKMGSDLKKPLGISVLYRKHVAAILWPLPIGQMFGVGTSTAAKFERLQIRTIGDLAAQNGVQMAQWFGKRALDMHAHANGEDNSPVTAERAPMKSIGHSTTLSIDEGNFENLCDILFQLCDRVGRRVRNHLYIGKTVQVTIRFSMQETITRARTLTKSTALTEDIYQAAKQLLQENLPRGRKVRLLGVSLGQLSGEQDAIHEGVQSTLFTLEEDTTSNQFSSDRANKLQALTKVTDSLRNKYGEAIVVHGRLLQHRGDMKEKSRENGTSLQRDNLE